MGLASLSSICLGPAKVAVCRLFLGSGERENEGTQRNPPATKGEIWTWGVESGKADNRHGCSSV